MLIINPKVDVVETVIFIYHPIKGCWFEIKQPKMRRVVINSMIRPKKRRRRCSELGKVGWINKVYGAQETGKQ